MEEKKMSLVEFKNGKVIFFDDSKYKINWVYENGKKNQLQVIYLADNTVSMEADAENVLYVRYHVVSKRNKDKEGNDDE